MERLKLNQLKPGMYVVSVTEQQGSLAVTTQGYLRSEQAITLLAQKGVLEVMIDPSKTLFENESNAPDSSVSARTVSNEQKVETPRVSFEKEIGKAAALYDEAKALQDKAFAELKSGRPISLAPMKTLANGIMDSVFRNQDALLCVSRMRDKDAYLLEHSINVSILMTVFARQLRWDESRIQTVATGALLHDIGKILVPDAILNKPGRLTDAEMIEMKAHVDHGVQVLSETPGFDPLSLEVVALHHERLDGHGYPQQLSAEKISQAGRMIAIVDTYDAITATRCYKAGTSSLKAFKILREEVSAFDQDLVATFIRAIGMYPVGTLVKLKSDKVGLVIKSNAREPLSPTVKVFYHARLKQHISIIDIDLSVQRDDEIESAVMPDQFKLDIVRFFRHAVVGN